LTTRDPSWVKNIPLRGDASSELGGTKETARYFVDARTRSDGLFGLSDSSSHHHDGRNNPHVWRIRMCHSIGRRNAMGGRYSSGRERPTILSSGRIRHVRKCLFPCTSSSATRSYTPSTHFRNLAGTIKYHKVICDNDPLVRRIPTGKSLRVKIPRRTFTLFSESDLELGIYYRTIHAKQ
jgi:hypothetical protein